MAGYEQYICHSRRGGSLNYSTAVPLDLPSAPQQSLQCVATGVRPAGPGKGAWRAQRSAEEEASSLKLLILVVNWLQGFLLLHTTLKL